MKKEESKVIAQKLQNIPNGTLALKHCRAGGMGSTLFGEQFRAITAGKGCMETYETLRSVQTGGAWLSSARVVRCSVKSGNERNPYGRLPIFS